MSISIKLNKDFIMKNMLDWANYIAYQKYKSGILDNVENTKNIFELNDSTKALLAYRILNKAIYYTPVVTGYLRNSSYIKPYEDGYEVGYTCDYAIYVHEIGVNEHKYPTQYKYLEDAAFEVINEYKAETGIEIPVTIEYEPLRVFIGVTNAPGESLTGVKANEQLLDNPETYERILSDFMNFDYETASEAEKAYHDKLTNFYIYYHDYRNMNTMGILREWIDRTRHKLL